MAEDSGLEKTEQASQQRLDKAREEGDIPRSRELSVFVSLLASGGGIWFFGNSLVQSLETLLSSGMRLDRAEAYDFSMLYGHIGRGALTVLLAFAPLAGLLILVALAAPVLMGGWVMSSQALVPDFSRINPMTGVGNMFSVRTLVELVKAIAKAVLVGVVAWWVMSAQKSEMMALNMESVHAGITHSVHLIWMAYLFISLALGVVVIIDVPYQLWHYADKYKMTRQEVRQEARESDGDPQVRARIRKQQREMARRRMMAEVPKADVVVTNPTHYAVALKYTDQGARAPVVIAKGADEVAARIRELAAEHAIPLLEAPALARSLYRHVELEQEIPDALYGAVAEVLAYVFQLRVWRERGGQLPVKPEVIAVPIGMDPLDSVAAVVADDGVLQ